MMKMGLPLFIKNAFEGMDSSVRSLQTASSFTLVLEHVVGLHLTLDPGAPAISKTVVDLHQLNAMIFPCMSV